MKKIYLILLLLSIIFFPSNLHAKEFYIKLSFVEVSQEIHPNFGMDVYVEFTYHLNRYIGFSIGNGYISKTLTGRTSEYDRAGLGQIFTVFPDFSMEVIPICISLELSLPLTSAIKFNLKGGLGYYFMQCEGNTTWEWGGYNRSTYNFDGNSSHIGYHFGASYKIVNFKNMQSSEVSGSLETGEYLQWFMYETFTEDFDYQVSQASITGFSIRVGFKFKF
jgi:hypothetical protein